MSICAALAAKTRAKKAERIAQNLAQAARENAQLGLPHRGGSMAFGWCRSNPAA